MRTILAIALCIVLTSCQNHAQNKAALKSQTDSVSYAIGMQIGENFRQQDIDVNLDLLKAGMQNAIDDTNYAITKEEAQQVMQRFSQQMQQKQMEKQKAEGEKNLAEGKKFLAENAKKEGVKTTASGLQYKVIKMGDGPKPTADDKVVCDYKGTTINGKVFDSSYKRGKPATFPVNGVIKGWTEALEMMPVGSKWELYVPADLAYGERGAGPDIGPNSTLIFEVELHKIEPKEASKSGSANPQMKMKVK